MNTAATAVQTVTEAPTLYQRMLKRIFDFCLASLLLIILCPVLAVIGIVVRLTSPGPAIFRQKRIGQNGKLFTVLKFRTMRNGSHLNGNLPATANDERVTSVGKILRKTHWDELLQLINVLRGDMSFVGPRPLSPEDRNRFFPDNPDFELRCLAKPGLTCSTQFEWHYDYSPSGLRQRIDLDLEAIRSSSFWNDLRIIAGTTLMIARHTLQFLLS